MALNHPTADVQALTPPEQVRLGQLEHTIETGITTFVEVGRARVVAVAGTTCTLNILGSIDGTAWWNVVYATAAAPTTPTVAALTITTTTTAYYVLLDSGWRFLKCNLSANTGMTITIDAAA